MEQSAPLTLIAFHSERIFWKIFTRNTKYYYVKRFLSISSTFVIAALVLWSTAILVCVLVIFFMHFFVKIFYYYYCNFSLRNILLNMFGLLSYIVLISSIVYMSFQLNIARREIFCLNVTSLRYERICSTFDCNIWNMIFQRCWLFLIIQILICL